MESGKIIDKINDGYRLIGDKHSLTSAIRQAIEATDYEELLMAFRRAKKHEYLGDLSVLKDAFVSDCERDLKNIDEKIIELWESKD